MKPSSLLCLAVCAWALPALAQDGGVASDAEIRQILVDRIDTQHQAVGIVVGVIDARGRRVISYGSLAKGDARPLNGKTIFEIGSVTKVFTSLLLADMVKRKEVALTDPVSKYLPREVKVPERGGKAITLHDLATHTSGLPRMPDNFAPADEANPYADYTVERLYAFLSGYTLTRDIGASYEYSNLGAGLLAHALGLRAKRDFEGLVRERITAPLGMKSTGVTLSADQQARFATGHDAELAPAKPWDLAALAGAGALRSDADDMLTFLSAALGLSKSPLAPAMAAMLAARRPTDSPSMQVALAWHFSTAPTSELVWHNGGTGGFRSYLGFNPRTRVGVVVLSNTSTEAGVDDLGQHLLDPARPLYVHREHVQIALDPKGLSSFPGRYELAPNLILTVTVEDGGLFVQATGQPKIPAFPEGQRDFFARVIDAQVTFEPDVGGKAGGLVLHQAGRDSLAKRLEGEAPPPVVRKELAVDLKVLDQLVGRYVVSPAFALTLTREGAHFYLQATNQQRLELFAQSPTEFFLKEVDAQLTFTTDEKGRGASLVLHQGGANVAARRE